MFPDVEYSTDRDFFLENQIVCIVSREGTKFCSLIENRLFMRSQSRHISKRMQLHIMCEIHKEICRLRYGGEPVEYLPHPTPEYFLLKKSRAIPMRLPGLFLFLQG